MNKQVHPAILVAAATDSFRRAGHVFGREPKTLALGALSPEQHDAIVNDKSLVVVPSAVHLEAAELEALPHRIAKHVTTAKVSIAVTHLGVNPDNAKLAADIAAHEALLDAREAELNKRQADLQARADELARIADEQTEFRKALDAREAELSRASEELAKSAANGKSNGHTGKK